MKKYLLLMVAALLVICGCGGDDGGGGSASGGNEYLNVGNVDIAGGNTTATLSIQASNNCEWVVSSNDSWIRSISPTKGRGSQNVTLTVTVNPSSTGERTALVNVRTISGSISRDVTVTQSPSAESLELSMNTMTFTYSASSQEVTVTSNAHWTISGTASWLSMNKTEGDGNGSVNISVEENTTDTERSMVLTFKGESGVEKQLTVKQSGHSTDFTVSPTNINASALASTVQFSIGGDARWNLQSSEDWAMPDVSFGEGNKTVSVVLKDNTIENTRKAVITISSSSKKVEVTINQDAASRPIASGVHVSGVTRKEASVSFSYSSQFPVTECGVCISSTESNPTVDNDHTTQTVLATQGNYSTTLKELMPGRTYYLRAYAKSVVGFGYSNTVSFTTAQGEQPNDGDNTKPGW